MVSTTKNRVESTYDDWATGTHTGTVSDPQNGGSLTVDRDNYIYLNGTDSYVDLVGAIPPTSAITVEFWAKRREQTGQNSIIEGRDSGGNRVINIHLGWSTNDIYWDFGDSTYARLRYTFSNIDFMVWSHWAFVSDAASGRMEIFKDGVSLASGMGAKSLSAPPATLKLGRNATSAVDHFWGDVSELRIWTVARTETEIAANKDRLLKGDEPGLYSYYRLDEGYGTFVDSDGPDNDYGVVNGTVGWYPLMSGSGVREATQLDISGVGEVINTSINWESKEGLSFFHPNQEHITPPISLQTLLDGGTEATVELLLRHPTRRAYSADASGLLGIRGSTSSNFHYPYTGNLIYCNTFRDNRIDNIDNSGFDKSQWHWLTITTKPGTDGYKMFQNGQLALVAVGESTVSIDGNMRIGYNSSSAFWSGMIAEIRFWSTYRTEAEVNDAITNGITGNEAGLEAWYKLDEKSGNIIYDSVGGHDADVNGPDWFSIDVETRISTDNGATWSPWTITNQGEIPGIAPGDYIKNGLLEIRTTLNAGNQYFPPELESLTVNINGTRSAFKIWDGTQWIEPPVKYWDGTQWKTNDIRVYTGGRWL